MRIHAARRTIACLGLACMLSVTPACAQPTEAEKYARQLGLPKEVSVIVRQLEYDDNAKSLLDKLYYLPEELQVHEETLSYLRGVAEDKRVSDEEYRILYDDELDHDGDGMDLAMEKKLGTDPLTAEPEVKHALDSLESVSDEALEGFLNLGLDGDVVEYISFALSLPEDFAEYALESKLCIQDKEMTDLERSFLEEPEKHLQQMYDYYISEINNIDSDLARELSELPYFEETELEDVEVLEDVLYLASNRDNKTTLEKLYGKGIEREMHSVALEALLWRGFSKEFDSDNPLDAFTGDLRTLVKLAEFQEKYNRQMDKESVERPKPALKGINLLHEPLGNPMKGEHDLEFDYALIRWALRCNTVRLYGYNDYDVFHHVNLAQEEGLDVWLLFFPLFSYPDMDVGRYKTQLAIFANRAQENNVAALYVGAEFDAWWRVWGGYDGIVTEPDFHSERLRQYIDELADVARENYSGGLTYQEWDYWWKPSKSVNWKNLDYVSLAPYIGAYNSHLLNDSLYLAAFRAVRSKYANPLIIAEVGSYSVAESEQVGGTLADDLGSALEHDPQKQAEVIDRHLRLLYQVGADGIFVFCWDEPVAHPWGDMNKLGFGIWDYVEKEPKLSFWTVYKYYKD